MQSPSTAPQLRVAAVPARHPYVVNIRDAGVVLLEDPATSTGDGNWTPPAMLEPSWISSHADEFDVYHLHFGTESYSIDHLRDVVTALERVRRPLIYTAHDLVNPQLIEQSHHLRQLDLMIPAADAVITLTNGAAREIERRWDRRAYVIPHPQIVPLDTASAGAPCSSSVVIGVHLRDLRPNIDALGITAQILAALPLLGSGGHDVRVRLEVDSRVRSDDVRHRLRELCRRTNVIDLIEGPRPTDSQLYAALEAVDVAVLPYSHGTHSGWVEMCWDLGVPVVGPEVGYFSEQHPDNGFYHRFDPDAGPHSLARAIADSLQSGHLVPREATAARRRQGRREQHRLITGAHLAVYHEVLKGAANN